MGKNQHSKDRLFITATEWATQYGGKKRKAGGGNEIRPLPFDHCALSLAPFTSPCMLKNSTGVIFEHENIIPYLKKYKSDPVSGDPMTESDIIQLHMDKNSDGEWQCPITNKVFTGSSHIVAIRTSGNVYSFSAIDELNLKPKNFNDLIDGSKFTRVDIVTIQDPQNPDIMAKHDISTFKHLQQVREDSTEARKSESKLRHSVASEGVMREIAKTQQEEKESGTHRRTTEEILRGQADVDEDAEDVARFKALNPLVEDVNPGQTSTDGKASISLTSTSTNSQTKTIAKYATTADIREAKWKIMRKIHKKAFVQLQTSVGNLNVELHCDMAMRTSWNFLTLCKRGYYNNTKFHRLIPGFMVQGGDPTGTGMGGESAFNGRSFKDEFDTRLSHDTRGILSMANSGPCTNKAQFFITFKETKYLDNKHTVFGKVVGGLATLDRIEQIATGKNDKPVDDVILLNATVFSDPIDECDQLLEEFIRGNMERRLQSVVRVSLPSTSSSSSSSSSSGNNARIDDFSPPTKFSRTK